MFWWSSYLNVETVWDNWSGVGFCTNKSGLFFYNDWGLCRRFYSPWNTEVMLISTLPGCEKSSAKLHQRRWERRRGSKVRGQRRGRWGGHKVYRREKRGPWRKRWLPTKGITGRENLAHALPSTLIVFPMCQALFWWLTIHSSQQPSAQLLSPLNR